MSWGLEGGRPLAVLFCRNGRTAVGFDPTTRRGRPASGPKLVQAGATRGVNSKPRPRLRPGRGDGLDEQYMKRIFLLFQKHFEYEFWMNLFIIDSLQIIAPTCIFFSRISQNYASRIF